MALIGILGGMGPLATVDFMDKVVRLTQASRDQEHLPLLVANLPHIADRSSAILGNGADPLPALLAGIDMLNRNGVGLIAIPCNSAHHWYPQIRAHSAAPVLNIAEICIAAVPSTARRVAVLATGGALVSGFYQRALTERDIEPVTPDETVQPLVAACIDEVKSADLDAAAAHLERALTMLAEQGVTTALMACTEVPLAAQRVAALPIALIDSSLELARATVKYACERGWNRPQ
ncbi:aspartate/glutamate racemase family protein [Paraburkholderia bengalensis]|uniref:Aspartate/glutamate racemase family protein n=1 Tax=Paraburkholderia bengalensis TaxID=2747562 RepID=A0ABU8IWM1_9BURK